LVFDGLKQHKLIPVVEIKCVDEKIINCLHGVLTGYSGIKFNLRKLKMAVIPQYRIVMFRE